uniref:Uncharacterized protein n=1 Tax=Arundo donax TaxID=35708 RepID=A0A0A9A631_ARUDO
MAGWTTGIEFESG